MGDISEDDVLLHAKPLLEEFTCPVCFELISECTSTPCGHSFCKECLDECLNRRKSCPTCTSPVEVKQVLPNKHFDRILVVIQEQKDKANKSQFEKLLTGGAPVNPDQPSEKPAPGSSIQTVFQKHLMKSLGAYEDYLKKLKSAAEASAAEITADFEKRLASAKKMGGAPTEMQFLRARQQQALEGIRASFVVSESQLQHEYDDFLAKNLVNPSFLPVQVILCIEATGARYPFVLEPTHTLRDLKKYLLTKPAGPQTPDIITRISSKKNPFVLRPPFAGPSEASVKLPSVPLSIASSSSSKNGMKSEVKLDQKHAPLSQTYDIFPGSQIVMLGQPFIKTQTKECFKSTFLPEDESTHKCTFMKCNTCNKNWICKDCAQACHEGHDLTLHVAEQVWKTPNCYCTKTGKCTLYQKK